MSLSPTRTLLFLLEKVAAAAAPASNCNLTPYTQSVPDV